MSAEAPETQADTSKEPAESSVNKSKDPAEATQATTLVCRNAFSGSLLRELPVLENQTVADVKIALKPEIEENFGRQIVSQRVTLLIGNKTLTDDEIVADVINECRQNDAGLVVRRTCADLIDQKVRVVLCEAPVTEAKRDDLVVELRQIVQIEQTEEELIFAAQSILEQALAKFELTDIFAGILVDLRKPPERGGNPVVPGNPVVTFWRCALNLLQSIWEDSFSRKPVEPGPEESKKLNWAALMGHLFVKKAMPIRVIARILEDLIGDRDQGELEVQRHDVLGAAVLLRLCMKGMSKADQRLSLLEPYRQKLETQQHVLQRGREVTSS